MYLFFKLQTNLTHKRSNQSVSEITVFPYQPHHYCISADAFFSLLQNLGDLQNVGLPTFTKVFEV